MVALFHRAALLHRFSNSFLQGMIFSLRYDCWKHLWSIWWDTCWPSSSGFLRIGDSLPLNMKFSLFSFTTGHSIGFISCCKPTYCGYDWSTFVSDTDGFPDERGQIHCCQTSQATSEETFWMHSDTDFTWWASHEATYDSHLRTRVVDWLDRSISMMSLY